MKRYRIASWFACLALGASLTAGCGSAHAPATDGGGGDEADARPDDDDAGGQPIDAGVDALVDPCGGPIIAFEDFGHCYAIVMCEYMLVCGGRVESFEQCLELIVPARLDIQFRRFADAIAAGRVNYDGAAAYQCLSAMNPEDCADFDDEPACEVFFEGTVAAGETCFERIDCAVLKSECDDLGCELQCCPGTCLSPAGIGMVCDNINCVEGAHCVDPGFTGDRRCYAGEGGDPCNWTDNCDENFYCDPGTSSCLPDVGGAACTMDEQCTPPTYCVGDAMPAGTGSCEVANAVGHPCDEDCDSGLHCNYIPGNATPGTCQPQPTVGQSCEAPDANCPYNTYCDGITNLCTPRVGVSGSCTVNPCRVELICGPSEFCVERPGLNVLCTPYACSFGLFCSAEITGNPTGVCWEPQPTGAACDRSSHCQGMICAANDGGSYVCQDYEVCE